ncbi:MAG TPA: TetR/AcrR family transcriptional regulator [Kofleriaceae bacterium]
MPRKRAYDNAARNAAAQQTRERMMRAALELASELTYDEITFPRVAERAGVSAKTVALHFKTKAGLVTAVSDWWRPHEEALREVADGDPAEAARKVCARYEGGMGRATLHLLAIEERVPEVRPLMDTGRASHRGWVERTFGKRLGSGAARERRVMALVAAYDVYTWHVLRRTLSLEDTIQTMAELARGVLDLKGGRR